MSSSTDKESEILLGNKQLLAVFGVASVLLAVAFTGGYMVGKNSGEKKAAGVLLVDGTVAGQPGGITSTVTPGSGAPDAVVQTEIPHDDRPSIASPAVVTGEEVKDETPLGARKQAIRNAKPLAETEPVPASESASFRPQAGQTFLQVLAVAKDEADGVADVLHKEGFRAHSVPKPGNAKIYRVLIGPIKDAGDLATTRDSLRRTGFRDVITQRY